MSDAFTPRAGESPDASARPIVIASPHARNDSLEMRVRTALPGRRVVRIRSRAELVRAVLEALDPELVVLPHWSWLVPASVHERFECVIFHMTDLPYGRGGSPLQNLIVRGHTETMISALRCEAGLDTGPVYFKRRLSLDGTAEEILQRASDVIAGMIVDIVRDRPVPVPQAGDLVTFTRRRARDGDLAPLQDLQAVHDYIRMLDAEGYPPAFVDTEHLHIEFAEARVMDDFVTATVRIRRRTP